MGRGAKNLARNLIQGKNKSHPDSVRTMPTVDTMIDNAKRMRRKPFERDLLLPDKPEKAANDATAKSRRKLDNTLSTMDKHGVSDIVRNLAKKKV